jgi:transposase
MSLQPRPIPTVPEETARIAQAAFPKRSTFMRMRDELGAIFSDEQFAELFSNRG